MTHLIKKLKRTVALALTNSVLQGAYACRAKRSLPRWGVAIQDGSSVVGPVHMGTVYSLQLERTAMSTAR